MKLRSSFENVLSNFQADPLALEPGTVLVENVSKRFRKQTLAKKSYSTVKTSFLNRFFSRRYPRENYVEALKDITLKIEPGYSLGLIGSNGSGKSTLLKLISGIYRPHSGRILRAGRISALIELGAGFHPDFTGRENIYLGGVMFGLTRKEIDARYDDIVKYAELEDFIDDPVRTYSSGMYMRLGFSLAVHTDPDILLIDEVLAVGDASFIHRCHETISEFKRRGKTLIFVTHDLESVVRWCDEAIWLEKGDVKLRGEPREVIDSYLERVSQKEEAGLEAANAESLSGFGDHGEIPGQPGSKRWGTGEVEITAVRMLDHRRESKWVFHADEPVSIEVDYLIRKVPEELVFGIGILRADGIVVHGNNTDIAKLEVPLPDAPLGELVELRGTYRYHVTRLGLVEDSYFLDVAAHRNDGTPFDYHHLRYRFSVRTHLRQAGFYTPEHEWEFAPEYPVLEREDKKELRGKKVG